ncbi:orotidine-5'-phosphate decarboxylase [Evansella halocellulosilytica]|uniref:orotidine-5'-phosphate decarboxylase n=1 Tax=Evansella halocellulosilytica TaxID=2011013 RepID=UPI000BB826F5|nr:orotidine-5'-phosphate decarboxylase [Evansella halocellulosilytica]
MQSNPLIIALDFADKKDVDSFLNRFDDEKLFVKVGMELFYREGPSLVYSLKEMGHHVFLDLKLHDIPHTVKRAMTQLAKLEVDLVNVHAMGGVAMMEAAAEGLDIGTQSGQKTMCIAVTQLTSTSEEVMKNEQGITGSLPDHVLHLCKQVRKAKLDGVVCSALEVPMIQAAVGSPLYTVTPGIRRISDRNNDQHRVVTPQQAREYGSDAIVVGRGVTRAEDPLTAYKLYETEWREFIYDRENC